MYSREMACHQHCKDLPPKILKEIDSIKKRNTDTMEQCNGRMALVTGASSGIGLCFCRELARRGCNLLMISNQKCLQQRADDIAGEYGVKTYSFFCDLTLADSIEKILRYIDVWSRARLCHQQRWHIFF